MMNNSALSKSTNRTVTRLLFLLAVVALAAAGCSKADNTSNSNASSTNKNSTTSTANTSTSTSTSSTASSPTAAYKAFQEANKKKDYAAVKSRFSKASLEMLTEEAKKQNKTLDEFVKDQVDKGTSDEEVLNEKIDGDSATVDLKDKNSSITLPMVKEDGEWKIAYDRFIKQMQEAFDKMSKEGAKPPASNQNSNNDNDNE
jgi:hypothetical protein